MFKLIQKMLLNELEHHVNTTDTEVTLGGNLEPLQTDPRTSRPQLKSLSNDDALCNKNFASK